MVEACEQAAVEASEAVNAYFASAVKDDVRSRVGEGLASALMKSESTAERLRRLQGLGELDERWDRMVTGDVFSRSRVCHVALTTARDDQAASLLDLMESVRTTCDCGWGRRD